MGVRVGTDRPLGASVLGTIEKVGGKMGPLARMQSGTCIRAICTFTDQVRCVASHVVANSLGRRFLLSMQQTQLLPNGDDLSL